MPEFKIPLGPFINDLLNTMIAFLAPFTRSIALLLDAILRNLESFLQGLPPLAIILVLSFVAWYFAGRGLGIFSLLGLTLMYGVGLWPETISTIALLLVSTFLALLIGIPVGILASQSDRVEKVIRPILDFMQTIPAFVYLIPAVIFFGLGKVSAIAATLIFAAPPAIRLTNLGIRQVPGDMIEASKAFGSNRYQILFGVQLPLAMPTIMAGVNQCIMMALSMAVISAMIGGGGLGSQVLRAMQRVNLGLGVESGLGIVIIAILFDRITESLSKRKKEKYMENNHNE